MRWSADSSYLGWQICIYSIIIIYIVRISILCCSSVVFFQEQHISMSQMYIHTYIYIYNYIYLYIVIIVYNIVTIYIYDIYVYAVPRCKTTWNPVSVFLAATLRQFRYTPPTHAILAFQQARDGAERSHDWVKPITAGSFWSFAMRFAMTHRTIGSMYGIYMLTFGVYWWYMLPYIAYMDPMGDGLTVWPCKNGFEPIEQSWKVMVTDNQGWWFGRLWPCGKTLENETCIDGLPMKHGVVLHGCVELPEVEHIKPLSMTSPPSLAKVAWYGTTCSLWVCGPLDGSGGILEFTLDWHLVK